MKVLGPALALFLALLCLAPLVLVGARALDDLPLEELTRLWTSESNRRALKNTLVVGSLTALGSGLLGLFLAWAVVRTDLPGRRWFGRLFPIPFLVPPYIGAIAWINLANPRVGWINRLLGDSVLNIYTLTGMVWVLTLFFYAVVYLQVRAALLGMDASLEEAARVAGASRFQVLKDVTVPLVRPALLSSMVLVFAASMAAFGVPAMVGTPGRVYVLTTRIFSYLSTGSPGDFSRAAALSLLLLSAPLILFWLAERWVARRRHAVVTGKSARAQVVALGRGRWFLFAAVLLAAAVAVFLPLGAVVFSSIVRHAGDLAPDGWTLARYRNLWSGSSELGRALSHSLGLAAGAATAAVGIGALVAVLKVRGRGRWRGLPDFLASIPYATPGTVVALGLILALTRPIYLVGTLWILLIAYVVKYLAFPARTAADCLGQIDASLEEAARVAGAGPLTVARTVQLPLLLPGLVAGWFLVFLPSFSELTMSVLLVGADLETIGTFLFQLQQYKDPPSGSVLAVVVIATVVLCNGAVRLLTRGRFGL